jgi:hypothetical protein
MRNCRGNRSARRKPAPVPLCKPQIPHDLTWASYGTAFEGTSETCPLILCETFYRKTKSKTRAATRNSVVTLPTSLLGNSLIQKATTWPMGRHGAKYIGHSLRGNTLYRPIHTTVTINKGSHHTDTIYLKNAREELSFSTIKAKFTAHMLSELFKNQQATTKQTSL